MNSLLRARPSLRSAPPSRRKVGRSLGVSLEATKNYAGRCPLPLSRAAFKAGVHHSRSSIITSAGAGCEISGLIRPEHVAPVKLDFIPWETIRRFLIAIFSRVKEHHTQSGSERETIQASGPDQPRRWLQS